MSEKTIEQRNRRALKKNGYILHKSRAKNWSIDNQLGYMIVDASTNLVIRGNRFDLTLDDVTEFVEQ